MSSPPPIFLFTDFGYAGPYVGQMIGAILAIDANLAVINLMHDAPAMRPDLAAYLLPAVCRNLPENAIVVAIVDPGVGSERPALVVKSGTRSFVGPDNGLLSKLPDIDRVEEIDWRPSTLSSSFHGRDLFAPVAARLALGNPVSCSPSNSPAMVGHDWPCDLDRIVYIDRYGNLMSGLSAEKLQKNRRLSIGDMDIGYADTFSAVPAGSLFWYGNSQGLVEVAANGTSAATILSLALGDKILLN